MAGEASQAIAAFALAAIPGVLVVEIVEYARPRFRDRSGVRALASYLILSLLVWASVYVLLSGDTRLAAVIDAGDASGQQRVEAYAALAWRLLLAAVTLGVILRLLLAIVGRLAQRIEGERTDGSPRAYGRVGDFLVQLVSMTFGWDRLLYRLRQAARPQIVHVRFVDGAEIYGVLAAGGGADFQADGRGLVLDAELLEIEGRLDQVPGSSGIFIAADAVASVAFVEYVDSAEEPATIS